MNPRENFGRSLCALSLAVAACGGGDAPPVDHRAALRADLTAFLRETRVPGVAAALVVDGEVLFHEALGMRSTVTRAPFTARTLVLTGSVVVKPLIAATLVQLAGAGRVDLQRPVRERLPWLSLTDESASVTLHQTLSMRGGLSNPLRAMCLNPTLRAALTATRPITSVAPPGEVFLYSSVGYTLGAAVIEDVEGRPFADVLRDRMFAPLGMSRATLDASVAERDPDHAAAHVVGPDGAVTPYDPTGLPHCVAGYDCSMCEDFRANAGLFVSIEDVGRLMRAMVRREAPMTEAVVAALTSPHAETAMGRGYQYGYGTFQLTVRGERFALLGTSYAGINGAVMLAPARRFGVALFANGDTNTDASVFVAAQHTLFTAATRILGLRGAPPDLRTSPASWSRLAGRYAAGAGDLYEVTQSADGSLRLANAARGIAAPVELAQGSLSFVYGAGETFHFRHPGTGAKHELSFFGPADGPAQYLIGGLGSARRAP